MRERLACNTAPIFLRLALGLIFLWAGFGKVMVTQHFEPEDAAILGNYHIVTPGSSAPVEPVAWRPQDGVVDRTPPPALDEDDPADIRYNQQHDPNGPVGEFGAGDFPNGTNALALHNVTLLLHRGIYPGTAEDGTARMPLWFDADATKPFDPWPVYMAWAVAVTEIISGGFLILGLLTRVGGAGILGVMLGAMWLTQIGPAIQSGETLIGFLPKHELFAYAWKDLFFQLLCAAGGLALFCTGSGSLALDRLVFGDPFGGGESGGKKKD